MRRVVRPVLRAASASRLPDDGRDIPIPSVVPLRLVQLARNEADRVFLPVHFVRPARAPPPTPHASVWRMKREAMGGSVEAHGVHERALELFHLSFTKGFLGLANYYDRRFIDGFASLASPL